MMGILLVFTELILYAIHQSKYYRNWSLIPSLNSFSIKLTMKTANTNSFMKFLISAIKWADGFTNSQSVWVETKMTTLGWQLTVKWKDGSTNWVPLKGIKNSNPIKLVECETNNRIEKDPNFNWWVKDVLKWRNRIIDKFRSNYWHTTQKIRHPCTKVSW